MKQIQSLYPFQREGVRFLTRTQHALLADEMGLGKTVQALAVIENHEGSHATVVCPAQLKGEWAEAVLRWLPSWFVYSIQETDDEGFGMLLRGGGSNSIGLCSYASLHRYVDIINRIPNQRVLVFDEAHYLKNRKARRSKAARRLARHSYATYLLTGTPPYAKPEEMWHLLHLIDHKRYSSYWRWFHHHVKYRMIGHAKIPLGVRDVDRYTKAFADVVLRRTKDEVLPDLPPLSIHTLYADLSGTERRRYDATLRDELKDEEGQPLQFANILAKITALRKLSTCSSLITEEKPWQSAKLDLLQLKLDEAPGQKVVFTHFRATRVELLARLGDRATSVRGLDDWKSERKEVLVDTFYRGGLGLNLQQANHMFFVEPPNGWTAHTQSVARIHRPGGTHTAKQVWRLVARGTVDAHLYRHLDRLQARADETELALAVWQSLKGGQCDH